MRCSQYECVCCQYECVVVSMSVCVVSMSVCIVSMSVCVVRSSCFSVWCQIYSRCSLLHRLYTAVLTMCNVMYGILLLNFLFCKHTFPLWVVLDEKAWEIVGIMLATLNSKSITLYLCCLMVGRAVGVFVAVSFDGW